MGCLFKDFNNKHIALFYLLIFPTQSTPKITGLLYNDFVHTLNLDATPASYDIKYVKELLKLDEQYQQVSKEQLTK